MTALKFLSLSFILLLIVHAGLTPCKGIAQERDSANAYERQEAFGVEAGYTHLHPSDSRGTLKAYYDVPIGPLYFTPGVLGYGGIDSGYAMQALVKLPIYYEDYYLTAALGGEISVWDDRVGIGIPVEFGGVLPIARFFQLTSTLRAQPTFYVGSTYSSFLYAIFVGLRIPVYKD